MDEIAGPQDIWFALRRLTNARIGLPRSGIAISTNENLAFQLAHARAQDAAFTTPDYGALAAALAPVPTIRVKSAAGDRATYIRRPDLGRRLDPGSHNALPQGPYDIVLVVGDGLSSRAVQKQAPLVITEIVRQAPGTWSVGPIVIAEQARVALGDEIGEIMRARCLVMLIGERPGLSSPDSLGIYMTLGPQRGRTDAERNCISNIHSNGLSHAAAASKLIWLVGQAFRLGQSGIALKDEEGTRDAVTQAAPEVLISWR
jgi:ethanolamine ammonia-lyase small subunit